MAQVISDVTTDIASQENSSGDCERPHILNQSKILEKGSLKGLNTGKSYNNCRRIHKLLAAGMDIFHFSKFGSRFDNES